MFFWFFRNQTKKEGETNQIQIQKIDIESISEILQIKREKKLRVLKPSARITASNRKQFLVFASQRELIIDAVRDLFVAMGVGLPYDPYKIYMSPDEAIFCTNSFM